MYIFMDKLCLLMKMPGISSRILFALNNFNLYVQQHILILYGHEHIAKVLSIVKWILKNQCL